MPIVVTTLAVIVPVSVMEARWPGGEAGYRRVAPNRTYRCDGNLAAIDFMTPADVELWIKRVLEPAGLRFEEDIAVVDARRGLTHPCDWLRFEARKAWGEAHLSGAKETPLTGPAHWSPEADLGLRYLEPEDAGPRIKFVALNGMLAAFEDEQTGETRYVGITVPEALEGLLDGRLDTLYARAAPLQAVSDSEGPERLSPEQKAAILADADEAERIAATVSSLESKALGISSLLTRVAGDYQLASRRWRRFLAGEPQFIGGWMELTWCLNMLGEHGEALAAAHKAVELDPQQPGALANLGGTLLEMGRKAEALVWIDRALALDPEDAITLSLREQAVRAGD